MTTVAIPMQNIGSPLAYFMPKSKNRAADRENLSPVEKKSIDMVSNFQTIVYHECILPLLNAKDLENIHKKFMTSLAYFSILEQNFRQQLSENPDVIEFILQFTKQADFAGPIMDDPVFREWGNRFCAATIQIIEKSLSATRAELENINKKVGIEIFAEQLIVEFLLLCYIDMKNGGDQYQQVFNYLKDCFLDAVKKYCITIETVIRRWEILGKIEHNNTWKGRPLLTEEDLQKLPCPFPPEPEWENEWQA